MVQFYCKAYRNQLKLKRMTRCLWMMIYNQLLLLSNSPLRLRSVTWLSLLLQTVAGWKSITSVMEYHLTISIVWSCCVALLYNVTLWPGRYSSTTLVRFCYVGCTAILREKWHVDLIAKQTMWHKPLNAFGRRLPVYSKWNSLLLLRPYATCV